jgi:ABC-type dipeptide/oligopeptide/nickel transport system permease component
MSLILQTISIILSIIISLYAAYLSYSCKNQYGELSRILLSICAFILGPIYLIYYFFVNFLTGNC